MGDLKLDTSGAIHFAVRYAKAKGLLVFYRWQDLSLFVQGYTEALLLEAAKHGDNHVREDGVEGRAAGFSDLAPETLARIIEDCEAWCATAAAKAWLPKGSPGNHSCAGRAFWNARNDRAVLAGHSYFAGMDGGENVRSLDDAAHAFPPLTLSLGDDGKIYLSNASQSEGVQL